MKKIQATGRRIVVITGGSRGIGRGLVQAFLKEGWQVAGLARRLPTDIPDVEDCVFLKADVRKPRTLERAAARIIGKWGGIDVWINNAGGGSMAPFVGHEAAWSDTFDLNFWGAVNGSRTAIKSMLASRAGGAIINIASLAGINACPGHSSYSISKAAVIALTRSLAVEYAEHKIRVNAVAPGPVESGDQRSSRVAARRRAESIPTRKLTAPAEIAEACLFLARPLASITGHTLVLDGGSAAAGCYAAIKR